MFGSFGFKFQPVAIAEFVRQAMFTAVLFGLLNWNDAQQMAVLQLVSLGLAFFTYNMVTSEATLEKAGSSKAAVAAEAEKKTAEASGVAPPSAPPSVQ